MPENFVSHKASRRLLCRPCAAAWRWAARGCCSPVLGTGWGWVFPFSFRERPVLEAVSHARLHRGAEKSYCWENKLSKPNCGGAGETLEKSKHIFTHTSPWSPAEDFAALQLHNCCPTYFSSHATEKPASVA